MKKILLILGTCFFAGCGQLADNPNLQNQLTEQESQILNYHLVLKQTETKTGDSSSKTLVLSNASVWNDGTGFGTRIDKTDGRATNQMEVVAQANRGAIRYYQDPWESSLSAQSSLQNVIGFPYKNVLQFISTVTAVTSWKEDGSLTYSGSDGNVRQALSNFNIQTSESTQITVRVKADRTSMQLETFYLTLADVASNITREYAVTYNGFNQQQMRELPVH